MHSPGATPSAWLDALPAAGALREVPGLGVAPGDPPFHVGTADDVRASLFAMKTGEYGRVTHIALGFRHAGMRNREVRRSMKRLPAKFYRPLQAS